MTKPYISPVDVWSVIKDVFPCVQERIAILGQVDRHFGSLVTWINLHTFRDLGQMGAKRRRGQREKDGGGGERRKGIVFSFSLDQLSRGSIPYFIQHTNNTLRIDKTRQYFGGGLIPDTSTRFPNNLKLGSVLKNLEVGNNPERNWFGRNPRSYEISIRNTKHSTSRNLLSLHNYSNKIEQALRLLFNKTHSSLMGKNYLQTHGTTMGTTIAVTFANIFI